MAQKIRNLPIGAKVRDMGTKYYGVPIGWQIADKNHNGYPFNSTTLVAENILKFCCFDAKERDGDAGRVEYGNNRYALSNLRQWLNKAGAGWYAAQHGSDNPPSNANVWNRYNEYDSEAGFLTGFGSEMRAALLETYLTVTRSRTDGSGSETVQDKVFLLSKAEVGLGDVGGIFEGSTLALFNSDDRSRQRKPTIQAVNNSEYPSLSASMYYAYWLRTPHDSNSYSFRSVGERGSLSNNYAFRYDHGVLPALNLSSDILVSDSPDSQGYYTIIWNNAPTTPPSITVPENVQSGKNLTVSWSASVDPEGDSVSYELERQYNNGGWSRIYSGSAMQFADTITTSMNSVAYRVRAKDSKDALSNFTTSPTRTVIHNVDPTISGGDQNLGVVTAPPSISYTVDDADPGDTLMIVESLDGMEIRTIDTAVRGQTYNFAISKEQFASLKGEHNMTITVRDSIGNSSSRKITFSRNIAIIDFDWKAADTNVAAQKILVRLRFQAHDNGVMIQVCNNFNDDAPTWETAKAGLKHIFSNKTKTASKWAAGVRVRIDKTGGVQDIACYSLSASYI